MSEETTPEWLRSEKSDGLEPLKASGEVEAPTVREGKAKIIYWSLKIVTMSLCLLMAATALLGLST
jgi:hypothetical protein